MNRFFSFKNGNNFSYNFRGQVAPNDIAVITFDKPVQLSAAVKPIALPEDQHCDEVNKTATLSGWGYESSWNPVIPTRLKWVKMPRISHEGKTILGAK